MLYLIKYIPKPEVSTMFCVVLIYLNSEAERKAFSPNFTPLSFFFFL